MGWGWNQSFELTKGDWEVEKTVKENATSKYI